MRFQQASRESEAQRGVEAGKEGEESLWFGARVDKFDGWKRTG
jgi:hypothetical protein